MKTIFLTITLLLYYTLTYSQPVSVFTFGFTFASQRSRGLEEFASSARSALNNGSNIKASKGCKGINLGIGYHSKMKEDTLAPYFRVMLNYSHQGGKAISITALNVRAVTNVLDATASIGIMNGKRAAFYAIIGPSIYQNRLDIAGNSILNSKYKSTIVKMSYGLGAGYFGEKGNGVCLDAFFNFKSSYGKKYYENASNNRIPKDYPTFIIDPAAYTGANISNAISYFRIQISGVISLGKK